MRHDVACKDARTDAATLKIILAAIIGAIGMLLVINFFSNSWFAPAMMSSCACSMMDGGVWHHRGFWLFFLALVVLAAILVIFLLSYGKGRDKGGRW